MMPLKRHTATSSFLSACCLCPRLCGADRTAGEKGFCRASHEMEVALAVIHRGEEPFLTGEKGVGNIFFSHCTMSCIYCQNHQISQSGGGDTHTPDSLADMLVRFQDRGCPTVGFVSPGHYLPLVAETIRTARREGLSVPVIWNSNGYETLEPLKMLEGLVDIYLPDLKYQSDESAVEYSGAPGYSLAVKEAIREMYRQTGPLRLKDGIAEGGLAVRHLVLPNDIGNTEEVLRFIAEISTEIPVSLMSQYNPVYRAEEFPLLSRRLSATEYWKAVETAEKLHLHRTLIQEPETSPDSYLPDFTRKEVFSD